MLGQISIYVHEIERLGTLFSSDCDVVLAFHMGTINYFIVFKNFHAIYKSLNVLVYSKHSIEIFRDISGCFM